MSYAQADFYDALAVDAWAAARVPIAQALAPAARCRGVTVDLGAGTGLSTLDIARACPRHEILACEPDRALRAALMTRILAAGLDDRVTVLPWDARAATAHIDEPVALVTGLNMIDHVADDDRASVWGWLRAHLAPGGRAVVGPLAAHHPPTGDADYVEFARRPVGRRTYVGSGRPTRTGDGGLTWHMRWQVLEHGDVVDTREAAFSMTCPDPTQLVDEVVGAGLAVEHLSAGGTLDLLVITRAEGT